MGWLGATRRGLVMGAGAVALWACARSSELNHERCGAGWVATEPSRCCRAGVTGCAAAPTAEVVQIAARTLRYAPADWEGEGAATERELRTGGFWMDRYELHEGQRDPQHPDPARALGGLSREQARALCTARGGRLPSDAEWLLVAMHAVGGGPRRYPWGDTGLVCRRGAWGLTRGPCARGASGPDTVGAHPDGQSADGVHDLVGNVAEWVETEDGRGLLRGGSFADDFAGNLRGWSGRELSPEVEDPRAGARCVYDRPPG